MSKWLLALTIAVLGTAMVVNDVEARRLGGSRSAGTQRSITNTPPASTPAKPGQQQAAPGQQQNMAQQAPAAGAAGTAGAAAAPSGLARWAPMLGGLALGGMLGYLFSGSGLGGMLLVLLLGVVAVLAFRAFARRRTEGAPQRMHYAGGMGSETVAAPPPSQSAGLDRPVIASGGGSSLPAGFDAAGFLRAAKTNFVRLQMANDAGNLDEIRDFTTPAMFAELQKDVAEQSGKQQTDVVSLNADLLEVATEGNHHWVSVRFSGMITETPGTAPVGFQEVWNLAKPVDGSSGWLLAGIQQMQ